MKKNINPKPDIFLSVVFVIHDKFDVLYRVIENIQNDLSYLVSDYEIIIIDNCSTEIKSAHLKQLTSEKGASNLQIYKLAGRVDDLTARWVGFENSIGDVIVSFDPLNDSVECLRLITKAFKEDIDIVFTRKEFPRDRKSIIRRIIYKGFGKAAKIGAGLNLDSYSSSLIGINRKVLNYLLQFSDPKMKFRNLPSMTGFNRSVVGIKSSLKHNTNLQLISSLSRGLRLITSSSKSPLRIATTLSAIGAFLSFSYSIYIFLIWMLKKDLTPGWISISLQQSGMFFLFSLVLLILSEYVLELSRKSNSGPNFYITEEYTSSKLNRKERLNVEFENKQNLTRKKNFLD
jgi:hypothetical protein